MILDVLGLVNRKCSGGTGVKEEERGTCHVVRVTIGTKGTVPLVKTRKRERGEKGFTRTESTTY